ncbi:type VI secretion system tip protein VgrG [Geomonas sp. RF6]|uniref:type VI secretion system Vgr family protein n=1 Tax=Geomonas sp. RF6 TaxID=2897342 RepID=UPI001E3163FD|nr:type VI secretion system tip protein VgrG [Geomonas sp. RF6]UFS70708.1 type VI secretion system tip protein VgrG [Geomonas sp. RF6]
MRLATSLGKDVLLVESLHGTEGISRLFSYDLALVSENQSISFDDIIGTAVTVVINLRWGGKRYINGVVSRFAQSSGGGTTLGDTRVSSYRATVVPWLWLLSRSAESKIYQNMSVPDIAEKIFKEFGFSDFELRLQGSYQKREFCVQYRETHFNFVSRLLEDEGIHYFFEHADGKHKLVLADAPQANLPCPGQKGASYQVQQAGKDEDFITSLEKTQEIRSGKYSLNDFNFRVPNTALSVELPSKYKLGPGEREIYDYPGEYGKKVEGDRLARFRMEEEEAQITSITGTSSCRAFGTGYRFTLNSFHRREMSGKDFVLTAIEHHASQSVQSGAEFHYRNSFTCIPAEVPFRPPRLTPRPTVHGSQTAVVVGPAGEEIYTDEDGRVKVQFHWDREGKKDEKSSCWIRVSQLWAGTNWGAIFIPRIGQEVVVDFLEGDPDRPIITGRVYNGINKPPYPLPAEKTKSTIKTNSSTGGGGFNEIRFEDKKGSEQLFIQAEKQLDVRVKKDSLEWVGNDRHLIVAKDQLEQVDGDKHLTVKGDQNEKVEGTVSLKVGQDLQQKVGAKQALEAGQEIHLKAGMKVVLEAGVQLTLKVGGNYVNIGPDGVSIKGAMVNVMGDALVNVKGAMVNINSGGSAASAGSGSGVSPDVAKPPKEADRAEAGKSDKPSPPPKPKTLGPQAAALKSAAESGAPFCDT